MNIQKKPFAIDFIGNNPEFVIRTDPYKTVGRRYSRTFSFVSLTAGTLAFSTPHGNVEYSVKSSADNGQYTMQSSDTLQEVEAQLNLKLKYNRFFTSYYDIEISRTTSRVLLKLTDREYKAQPSDITVSSTGFVSDVSVYATETGLNRTEKDKYRLQCMFEITKDGKTQFSPDFCFDDNNRMVTIGTDILKAYFDKNDIPKHNEGSGIYPCPNAFMKVKLLFAESENNEIGFVAQSPEVTLINGKIEQYARDNNIPDWESASDDKFYKMYGADIFGMDNHGIVYTDMQTEQYIYVCKFSAVIFSMNITYEVVSDAGTQHISAGTHQVPYGISRIPVSIANIPGAPSGIVEYKVKIYVFGVPYIERRYVIVPRPFNARTMLLLNRVNLYETFIINNVSKEYTTEGERATVSGKDSYVINDFSTKYTARTGLRTARQIAMLKDALDKGGNLLLDGKYAWKMSILPGSYTLLDEKEDLLDVEFQYILSEKFDRSPAIVDELEAGTVINYTDTLIR